MKKFLKAIRHYYERELATMQAFNAEFAAEFPAQAGQLGMEGGQGDDPHIERFIQATALSNARIAKLIEDNDQKVTEALLQINYPHYLQPFPSTAIVRVDLSAGLARMTAPGLIARGATLVARSADAPACRLRTVYDVQLTPFVVARVTFQAHVNLPPTIPRPAAVTTMLSIDIESKAANLGLGQVQLDRLRVFIDAEPSLCATTRDVLFMHARVAWLEVDGACLALDAVPLKAVGFDPHEAVLPTSNLSHPAYLLLTEYFVNPEKFNFFDIDWPALAPHLPATCRRLTLHLGLAGVAGDAHIGRALSQLSSENFILCCTPVVNLFRHPACPIELTHMTPDYALIADGNYADACDIYSVDKVTTVQKSRHGQTLTEFRPYYSLRHGEAGGRHGRYYVVRRDELAALCHPGHAMRIALVDLDLDPLAVLDASVSIELTCTNRDLPRRLSYGAAGGDLKLEQATDGYPLRFLRRPTPQYRFSAHDHWRLIAHLSLSHCSLSADGLHLLQETLMLYDLPQSSVSQRQIAGIVALEQRATSLWLHDDGHSSLMHGVAVRVTLDEDAFAGTGIDLFVSVLDRFFGLYVHCQSFTQLTVYSQTSGKELIRCHPRSGARKLV
ncbi:type VI secretion system baseplate subunit TssF [Massilia sp. S19_KUP03_FR1]|uniref:type VI secretion system baseplate subunit TssF n=1 Tax=Massilia sp. S19_KUP03_FR1 TaxID=3025503 RepID=UPI002FCDBEA3